MADLHVQPKKKGSILPWILLVLVVLGLIILLSRGCNKDKDTTTPVPVTDSTTTTTTTTTNNIADSSAPTANAGWNDVDFNAPTVKYEEISNKDIEVRGNDRYAIYGLGENILFDEGKSTLRPEATKNLQQIAASIQKRYGSGPVGIYGYTDATGGSGTNQQLSAQRTEAVRSWLAQNGSISADRLSLHPQGESNPAASNSTEAGRQQNRRVEIVARRQ
jgi:outer membrane protein OmpA-like peptidoglycan-associated protein